MVDLIILCIRKKVGYTISKLDNIPLYSPLIANMDVEAMVWCSSIILKKSSNQDNFSISNNNIHSSITSNEINDIIKNNHFTTNNESQSFFDTNYENIIQGRISPIDYDLLSIRHLLLRMKGFLLSQTTLLGLIDDKWIDRKQKCDALFDLCTILSNLVRK